MLAYEDLWEPIKRTLQQLHFLLKKILRVIQTVDAEVSDCANPVVVSYPVDGIWAVRLFAQQEISKRCRLVLQLPFQQSLQVAIALFEDFHPVDGSLPEICQGVGRARILFLRFTNLTMTQLYLNLCNFLLKIQEPPKEKMAWYYQQPRTALSLFTVSIRLVTCDPTAWLSVSTSMSFFMRASRSWTGFLLK